MKHIESISFDGDKEICGILLYGTLKKDPDLDSDPCFGKKVIQNTWEISYGRLMKDNIKPVLLSGKGIDDKVVLSVIKVYENDFFKRGQRIYVNTSVTLKDGFYMLLMSVVGKDKRDVRDVARDLRGRLVADDDAIDTEWGDLGSYLETMVDRYKIGIPANKECDFVTTNLDDLAGG